MKFSYNWLQSFFKQKLPPPKKLAELLTMHFMEVEGIERFGSDFVLNIDVLPNRGGDCFSHIGVVREISAITGLKYQKIASVIKEEQKLKARNFVDIEIKNKEDCPRYTARVVFDLKVGPSPKFIQDRLKACGLRPINNIVDVTNYVMLETGQPLHVFDFDKFDTKIRKGSNKKKIIIRRARKGEKILTLDNENYDLDEDILVIADSKEPLAIAGIKGGKKAEIDEKTRTVIIEAANFNPAIIRRASRKLNLITDASWRFEHGIDPNLTEIAINRAAELMVKNSIVDDKNPKIIEGIVDFYPQRFVPKKVKLDLNYAESLLGVKIKDKEIKNIFEKLNFKIIQQGNLSLRQVLVEVPTFRLDINIPEDLIEEIGRIYGYQNIKPVLPKTYLAFPKRNDNKFWENFVKNILKELGFCEVYNYSFISERQKEIFNFKKEELIALKNPLSLNQAYLRPSLIPNLLENVIKNQNYFEDIKIFELSKIFKKTPKSTEKKMLTGVVNNDNFLEAKGIVSLILEKMGISDSWYDNFRPSPEDSRKNLWHIKNSAEIKVGNVEIGFLGEISPKILSDLGIKNNIIAFDFDFEKLQQYATEEHEYRQISQFPAAIRDIAILVPQDVKVDDVLSIIDAAGGDILKDVDLFDFYVGENIPKGKKNLAFHLIFQAEDHALMPEEINKIQNNIIKSLELNSGWEVRK